MSTNREKILILTDIFPAKRTPQPAEGWPWRGASEASGACAKRFYSFSCKKKVPYMDQNEKKIFPFLNLTHSSCKRSTMKRKICPFSKILPIWSRLKKKDFFCSIRHSLGVKWKKNIFPISKMSLTRGTMKKKYSPWSICHPLEVKWKKNIPLDQNVTH